MNQNAQQPDDLIITGEVKNSELIATGNYAATCVGVVDIGTQNEAFNNKPKKMRKIMLAFEPAGITQSEGDPFILWKEYSLSMGNKSNLRGDIQSWIGRKLTDKEAESFNIAGQRGAVCFINVVKAESKAGKERRDIVNISPAAAGMQIPPARTAIFGFSVNKFNQQVFDTLPEWIQQKIKSSEEYLNMTGAGQSQSQNQAPWTQGTQNPQQQNFAAGANPFAPQPNTTNKPPF